MPISITFLQILVVGSLDLLEEVESQVAAGTLELHQKISFRHTNELRKSIKSLRGPPGKLGGGPKPAGTPNISR